MSDRFNFSRLVFSTCRRGFRLMSPEARQVLRCSILSAQSEQSGLFPGRAGQDDLYYTFFGLLLAAAAQTPIRSRKCRKTLNSVDSSALDLVHLCALFRSKFILNRLIPDLPDGRSTPNIVYCVKRIAREFSFVISRLLFCSRSSSKEAEAFTRRLALLSPKDFPLDNPESPYSRFLIYNVYSGFNSESAALPDLSPWRLKNALYSNLPETDEYSTAATAAAIFLLPRKERLAAAETLRSLQEPDGSFKEFQRAPAGDLLAAAVALFALKYCELNPLYNPKPFLRQCFRDNAFFAAVPEDPTGDLEYTFYGLLIMGTLA